MFLKFDLFDCREIGKGGFIISNYRSRKFLLTINNPLDYGFTHEHINECMKQFKWVYYCMCDEIGKENDTPHTHLYFVCNNAVGFNKVKKIFPQAHIDNAQGSSQDNRDYIRKEGKYLDSEKKDTNLIETFEEYGEMPQDTKAKNEKVSEQVVKMIKDGHSNAEILQEHPSCYNKLSHIDKVRETLRFEQFKVEFRELEVVYIWGESRCGKTRFVLDSYGYENVYRVSNYKNPFDTYNGQDVLLLDEFNSKIEIETMLQLLEGYPCMLPSRYNDKVACYTKVYVVSNIPFDKQFEFADSEQWIAFVRRFDSILEFGSEGIKNAEGYDPKEFEQRKGTIHV